MLTPVLLLASIQPEVQCMMFAGKCFALHTQCEPPQCG